MSRSTSSTRRSRSTAAGGSRSSAQSESRARRQNIRSVQRSTGRDGGGAAHPLFDHEDIRRWAEERGAVPTCVRGTGRHGETGMIRLEFPRFGEEPKLQPINWDQWFEKFDQNGLALLVQEETGRGEKSNFNKLLKRSTVEAKAKPKVRGAH